METVGFYYNNERIGNDDVTQSHKNIMNQHLSNYTLFNPYNNDCMGSLVQSTRQPNVFTTGTYGVGPLGCNIQESTQLQYSKNTTNNVKISLHQRSYLSVPYLGRGNVDVGRENELKFGDTFKDKKSVVLMGECPFVNLDQFPIHDKDVVTKMSSVESGWYSGLNTRDLYKEKEYCKNNIKK
jgi:hypothetical protein